MLLLAKSFRWSAVRKGALMLVGLGERLAGEPGSDDAGEGGALPDVFVGAAQRVFDGLAGGQGVGDLLLELGEFALRKPSPVAGRAGARRHEGLLLGEGEPGVAQEQDDPDEPGRRFGIAALPGDSRWGREQAEFLVVAHR